jgi:sugar lactone lactonase YvrE
MTSKYLTTAAVALLGASNFALAQETAPTFEIADGYEVLKITEGLNFPTALTWDDQGRAYVLEAGGALYPERTAPMRILRFDEDGGTSEVATIPEDVAQTAGVGLLWHEGSFYFTHRAADDLTGAVSRLTPDGDFELLLSGFVDSQVEHQINDIRRGPDGRIYVTVGLAGNAGVMGPSVAPWISKSPKAHAVPCQDLTLTGRNFRTPDFRTKDNPDDMALTGAFVPFGTETEPGQTVPGNSKCGGAIHAFDPADPEGTLETVAWGFRNIIGLAWGDDGALYAAQNGYDIRGARPVKDEGDPLYRVESGAWYGVPNFSAALEPLDQPQFEPPDDTQAMVVVDGEEVGKTLGFVIDHAASGLDAPDPQWLVAMHPFNSSPSMIDTVPSGWGSMAGHIAVAEWGDLAPPTNPLRGKEPVGSRVVLVNPDDGTIMSFISNSTPGPATMNDMQGEAFDHPFDAQFGPDGSLYIVDYGAVEIVPELKEQGRPPYKEIPGTGVIWKVSSSDGMTAAGERDTGPSAPMVDAEGASSDGNSVTIPRIVAAEDGFLVVHTILDGEPVVPASIGHVAIEAGEASDVTVDLDFAPVSGESYMAMLHVDSDGDESYSFGPGSTDLDGPVMMDGQIVMDAFSID